MSNILFKGSWTSIIFKNRNQTYGAFELRKLYEKNIALGFIIGVSVFVFGAAAPFLYERFKPKEVIVEEKVIEIVLTEPKPIDKKKVEVIPPPPPKIIPPKVIAAVRFTPPRVVPDEEVKEDPPVMDSIKVKAISNVNQKGEEGHDDVIVEAKVEEVAVIEEPKIEEPVLVAEEPADFPGGYMNYIAKNLKYPRQAIDMQTQGTAYIEFVVEKDGALSGIKLRKGFDESCNSEAIRVLSGMPKWNPAKMNGRAVRLKMTVPIKFILND